MLASEETLQSIAAAVSALDADSGPHTGASSAALGKSLVVMSAPGTLYRALATNTGGSDAYLFVLDATSLPVDGALPAAGTAPILVPAGSVNGDEYPSGLTMSVGCVLALSTTVASLTLVGSDVGLFSAIKG